MTDYETLGGLDVPWYEPGNCIMCGFSHRYQWPSGSDASGHAASYVACVNSLMYALADALSSLPKEADHG